MSGSSDNAQDGRRKSGPAPLDPSVDAAEVAGFEALAGRWWDPDGPFRPLHRFNPVRVGFIRERACAHFDRAAAEPQPLAGLSLLDIGTGGGLVAEPMARLGAAVTGIDPAEKNIAAAAAHAEAVGLGIAYRATTAESLAAGGGQFDIVLALETVEHVAELDTFLDAATRLVAPGGLFVAATLNRTAKAYALAIVGAEYVLGWLPRGTHDWNKFITPAELTAAIEAKGLNIGELTGVTFNPLTASWRLSRDTAVNYMVTARKGP